MSERTATLKIATPEGVVFSMPLAGPTTRGVAYFIDFVVLAAAFNFIQPVFQLLQLAGGDLGLGLSILFQFVFIEGARMLMELLWRGQTVGKKILGLRVVDEHGLKLKPSQVVIRNLLRFVDAMPVFFYAVGGAVALMNSRSQRLGDLAAGTVVIRTLKVTPPDVENLLAGKYNTFREYPHLEARLRQKVSPEEAQLTLQTLARREELDTAAQVNLFTALAEHLKKKVAFPEEAVHGISDEQYVRNVADSVFRRRKA